MQIDERIRKAYEQTRYRVFEPACIMRVGEQHPQLDTFLKSRQAGSWAFITAVNPGSKMLPQKENAGRQRMLEETLQKQGYIFFAGEGAGVSGDWPPEPSVLVLDIPEKEALELARTFGQLAIVYGRINGKAQLLWTGVHS